MCIAHLLNEDVAISSIECKKIMEGLIRRLRDVDDGVVMAATHALGHIRGHIGDDVFTSITKKLSFAHQQVINAVHPSTPLDLPD